MNWLHSRLWVYWLLPLGLLPLAGCGSGGVQVPPRLAAPTAQAPLPAAVRTDVPQAAPIPSTGPAGLPPGSPAPTRTPVPPTPTRDPARPITYAELRAASPAPGGSPYDTAPLRAWAVDRAVQGWQGWVVDVDRPDGNTTIPAVIVMDDPYAPAPVSAAGAPAPPGAVSGLAYVLLKSLPANPATRLQVGQQVRFSGTIDKIDTDPHFGVWLRDTQVAVVADPPPSAPVPPDLQGLRIGLARDACFGPCPVYRVTVFGSGLLVWEGDRGVPSAPPALGTLEAEIDAILDTAPWVGKR